MFAFLPVSPTPFHGSRFSDSESRALRLECLGRSCYELLTATGLRGLRWSRRSCLLCGSLSALPGMFHWTIKSTPRSGAGIQDHVDPEFPLCFSSYIGAGCGFIYVRASSSTYIHHPSIHPSIHTCIRFNIMYIHTYIRTYVHTYIHTYIHTYLRSFVHSFIHSFMHACMHACMHSFIHSFTHSFIHSYTGAYLCTCVHTIAVGDIALCCVELHGLAWHSIALHTCLHAHVWIKDSTRVGVYARTHACMTATLIPSYAGMPTAFL